MSFLLDTDMCSAYLKGNRSVQNRFLQYGGQLHVSMITVGELFSLISRSGRHLFDTVCAHAVLANLAGRPGSGVWASEGEEAGNKAMEWLQRAVASGFRNRNLLRIESALDPLRNRDDFKTLMAELEKNSPSQQAKK